jgi:hypothetical protein
VRFWFPAEESKMDLILDWAVWRLSEEIEMADWMSWRDVGLEEGACWESVKEVSHGIGKRVALHAWRIAGGTLVAEERERTRERKERKNKEAIYGDYNELGWF